MPKLKYKKHDNDDKKKKKSKKKHHRSRSPKKQRRHDRHRHRYYSPPKIYNEEPEWIPVHDQPNEEDEWRQRLFEAMADDEGHDPFYAQYDNYHVDQVHTMNDEEYREHIAQGMFRRQNAEAIAHEERRQAERERRERERQEAQERMRQEHAKMVEEQKRQEAMLRRRTAIDSREQYELKWKHVESASTILSKKEIPWPVCPGTSLSAEHVKEFVLASAKTSDETRKMVRKEQLRYHPDKFVHRVLNKFQGTDKEKTRLHEKANEVSGWLNEIWQDLAAGR